MDEDVLERRGDFSDNRRLAAKLLDDRGNALRRRVGEHDVEPVTEERDVLNSGQAFDGRHRRNRVMAGHLDDRAG